MKKMFLILGILSILLITPFHVAARAPELDVQPEKYVAIEINGNKAIVPFLDLGYRERTLVSPYGVTNLYFNTPLSWKLVSGGEIEIHYDVFFSGADLDKVIDSTNPYGGNLLFTFNGQIIGTAPLEGTGSHTVRLEIPDTALLSILQDGRHQLTISLDAHFSCDYDINARIVIKPTSFFDLVFEESSPELNLSRLPSPFYLENSFIPDSTLVVVADEPGALELQSALNVMAGFGSMIGREYSMQLITLGQLAGFDPSLYHMIFVGTADRFPILTEVNFQIPIADGKFVNLPPASEGDGVVELAISPWNPSKVIMAVSGNSGEAVMKAGQAVSSGRVFVYSSPTLAFVSNVQVLSDTLPIVEDFTFESLGYVTETLSGIGVKSQEYIFYVSKEQVLTKDAYVDLIYYHSGLLDYGVSSFSVDLNGQVISSTPFNKESEQVTTLRIKFPPGTLRFGENRLDIRASMIVLPSCDTSGFSDPWFTISSQSSIHLPVATAGLNAEPLLKDLKFFPELFVTHSDLGDIAFIFPKSDVASWVIAGKLAFSMGQQFNPLIANLEAAYSDEVPQGIHDDNSMIILGLASETPFLTEFNDMLPAPFDMANNVASERQMQVVYRIPDGVSVGYLELMLSPFNSEKSILVVSGNDRAGVLLAGDGLLVNELETQLAGVFAITNGKQVATGNASSPFSIVDNVVPGAVAVNTTPIPEILNGGAPVVERPVWLLPAIIISSLIVVGVLGYVAVSALAKRRQERLKILAGEARANQTDEEK
ncbi:cellulose biosynthesis cyclic di-GMP-binding regulatory protein BcsB [Candidatus Villigracilis affinis]|uniref:cellulose biosynthesis cyclic di-GMP-binding regulatory protein BcsB n=1 Tax=Candidatus Villigracilis affinis TaxID=3140682 RepID=UPI001DAD9960|nr:cellulose biosynthesis cyclic di-GMP-binding regulatory protein BcsB [Anaerolineales bacterium]